jgi:hypothetical protein
LNFLGDCIGLNQRTGRDVCVDVRLEVNPAVLATEGHFRFAKPTFKRELDLVGISHEPTSFQSSSDTCQAA